MTFGEHIYPTTAAPYTLYQEPLSKERISKGQAELIVKAGDTIIKANHKISDEHDALFLIIFLMGVKVIGLYIKCVVKLRSERNCDTFGDE